MPPTRRNRRNLLSRRCRWRDLFRSGPFGAPAARHRRIEEAASQPAGGGTEPRMPVVDRKMSRMGTEQEIRAPLRPAFMAKRAAARCPSNDCNSNDGTLPCSIISRPPHPGCCPIVSVRTPAAGFSSSVTRSPPPNLTSNFQALSAFPAGKQQPFSSADERVVRPFRDDAR